MKNQICTGIGIAAMFCVGTATVASAQMSVIPSAANGFSPFSSRMGVFPNTANGFSPFNAQMSMFPNTANGFSPFNSQMSMFPNTANGFSPFNTQQNGAVQGSGFFGGFNPSYGMTSTGNYGGYYGYGDPAFTVTPNGIVPLGNGYGGGPSDSEILQSTYAQGYQDAMNQAAQSAANNTGADTNPTGMSASPRGGLARVPHGSDGVRMWRVGRGQVALRWQGDSRIASSVTFSVTDRSGRALRSTTVSQLPVEVHFTPPPNAAFYQAVVHYVDGGTNTIMGRLPQ